MTGNRVKEERKWQTWDEKERKERITEKRRSKMNVGQSRKYATVV